MIAPKSTSNTAVTWSATGGTISSTGLFTAPVVQTISSVTVTARSQSSLDARASATRRFSNGSLNCIQYWAIGSAGP